MSNKLTSVAREVLAIESDLPFRFDYTKGRRPTVDDFMMYTFVQTWGSTALGFGGIGGQAMTSARTYVFVPESIDERCYVYFGGRYAYAVPYSQRFMEDVAHGNMRPVYESAVYIHAAAPEKAEPVQMEKEKKGDPEYNYTDAIY